MCLDRIERAYERTTNQEHTGWKVFESYRPKTLRFKYRPLNNSWTVPTNVWLQAKSEPLVTRSLAGYNSGFHIYTDQKEARGAAVPHYVDRLVRVYYRKVAYKGTENGCSIVIAQEMFVPKPRFRKRRAK